MGHAWVIHHRQTPWRAGVRKRGYYCKLHPIGFIAWAPRAENAAIATTPHLEGGVDHPSWTRSETIQAA